MNEEIKPTEEKIVLHSKELPICKLNSSTKGCDRIRRISKDTLNFNYRPFHKILPRSLASVKQILVMFYETDCISALSLENRKSKNLEH